LFREDLYYRLNGVTVAVPALRERGDDVALLAEHFARKYATAAGKPVEGFAPGTLDALRAYAWPGNVRELEHAVERAVALARWIAARRARTSGAIGAPRRLARLTCSDISSLVAARKPSAAWYIAWM